MKFAIKMLVGLIAVFPLFVLLATSIMLAIIVGWPISFAYHCAANSDTLFDPTEWVINIWVDFFIFWRGV